MPKDSADKTPVAEPVGPALPETGTPAELALAAGHEAWLGAAAGAQLGFPSGPVKASDYLAAVERVKALRFS